MTVVNFTQDSGDQPEYKTIGSAWAKKDSQGNITGISCKIGYQKKDKESNERVETIDEIVLKAGDGLFLNVNQYKTDEKHPDYRIRVRVN